MASKRQLKKYINGISEQLCAEALAASLYSNTENLQIYDTWIVSILKIRRDCISRLSHKEPGMTGKAYLTNVLTDFNKHITEAIDHFESLS